VNLQRGVSQLWAATRTANLDQLSNYFSSYFRRATIKMIAVACPPTTVNFRATDLG
jgi:hypothetical protein